MERQTFLYLISPQIIAEIKDVLQRPALKARMVADSKVLIALVEHDTERIPGDLVLANVGRDPKEDMFTACAVERQANYLVSNDRDLLDLGTYDNIEIITPGAFITILDKIAS